MSVADKTVGEIKKCRNFSRKWTKQKDFFMKRMRRTKIRFEKHELTLIRLSRKAKFFCLTCRTETFHLTVAHTAKVFGISEKTVFTLAANERIHSIETADGRLLICADSAAGFEKEKEKLNKNGQIGK